MELLLQSASAAASVGLGCGTCCGSGIGVVLSGYLVTHAKDWKQSWKGAGWFYMGKLLSVAALCVAASLAGGQLMDESGKIAGFPMRYAVNALMLCAGIYFLVQWFRERRGLCSCNACGHCGSAKDKIYDTKKPHRLRTERLSAGFLWAMGAGYGLTPCAPLIMVVGYTAAMPLAYAALIGCVFALASSLSPMLFLLTLSGTLGGQMRKEIPQYLSWFRLACYVCLIGCVSANLLTP